MRDTMKIKTHLRVVRVPQSMSPMIDDPDDRISSSLAAVDPPSLILTVQRDHHMTVLAGMITAGEAILLRLELHQLTAGDQGRIVLVQGGNSIRYEAHA
jgi:hypothetical protein